MSSGSVGIAIGKDGEISVEESFPSGGAGSAVGSGKGCTGTGRTTNGATLVPALFLAGSFSVDAPAGKPLLVSFGDEPTSDEVALEETRSRCGDGASCAAHIDAKLPVLLAPDVAPLNPFGFAATLFVIALSIAEVTVKMG